MEILVIFIDNYKHESDLMRTQIIKPEGEMWGRGALFPAEVL